MSDIASILEETKHLDFAKEKECFDNFDTLWRKDMKRAKQHRLKLMRIEKLIEHRVALFSNIFPEFNIDNLKRYLRERWIK